MLTLCYETNTAPVLVAILHIEQVSMVWALGLRNLQIPGVVCGLTGMPFDMARNMACMRALEMGVSHIFFLDSDVIAAPDAIHRLLAHKKPIISGLYCRRSPPEGLPVCMRPVGHWVTELPNLKKPNTNPIIEVDVVGAGCLLIETNVLREMQPQREGKHWFDWRVDLRGSKEVGGNIHS